MTNARGIRIALHHLNQPCGAMRQENSFTSFKHSYMKRTFLLLAISCFGITACKKDTATKTSELDASAPTTLRTSASGNSTSILQWQQCFGTKNNETAYGLARNSKGYLVVGEQSAPNLPTTGYAAFYVKNTGAVKTSTFEGNWTRGVAPSADDGFVVVTRTTNPAVEGYYTDGATDIMVLKFDSDGNILSKKALGFPGNQSAITIVQTTDNGFAISGYSTGFLFIKLGQNLNVEWTAEIPFGEYKDLFGYGITEDNNSYVLAGNSMDATYHHNLLLVKIDKATHAANYAVVSSPNEVFGFDISRNAAGEFLTTGRKDNILFVKKFDAQLNAITNAEKTFGTGGTGRSVLATAQGWLVVGVSSANNNDVAVVQLDNTLIPLSTNGNVTLGGKNSDSGIKVIDDGDGYAIGATTNSNNGNIVGNHGGNDMWLAKIKY
jgi:hypothetical protein